MTNVIPESLDIYRSNLLTQGCRCSPGTVNYHVSRQSRLFLTSEKNDLDHSAICVAKCIGHNDRWSACTLLASAGVTTEYVKNVSSSYAH